MLNEQRIFEWRITYGGQEPAEGAASANSNCQRLTRSETGRGGLQERRQVRRDQHTDCISKPLEACEGPRAQELWHRPVRAEACGSRKRRRCQLREVAALQCPRLKLCSCTCKEEECHLQQLPGVLLARGDAVLPTAQELTDNRGKSTEALTLGMVDKLPNEAFPGQTDRATSGIVVLLMCKELVGICMPRLLLRLCDAHEGNEQLKHAAHVTLEERPQLGLHQHDL
mmetsp:Transcript_116112/g.339491  ORF Transcript_116112/g.339491 Transcript_116112/m.339491 type:complete len:227 (+) Transcript_116112:1572-2252(+)